MAKSKSKSKNKKLAKSIMYTLGCGCGLFFLSMLIGGGFAGYWFYWKDLPPWRPNTPAGELARELDKNEPGWTHDALVAKWRGKPIDKNGAETVREISGLLPKDWSNEIQPLLETGMARNPGLSARLRPTLDQHRGAVSKARQFANLPDGRFTVEIKTNPLATPVPHLTDVRKTAILLKAMALRDAIDDNPNDAILAVQGIVHLSRYPKEEPFAISHLVHCAVVSIAALTLEDVFRHQGTKEPSERTLTDLQTLLLEEGSELRLAHILRCERATMHQVLERLRTKKLTLSDIAKDGNLPPPEGMDQEAHKQADSGQRVLLLRMNEAVDIANMPSHEQYGRYMNWDTDVRREMDDIKKSDKKEGVLGVLLLPAVLKIHDVEMRRCAKFRTAATGIAVERYRRANKSWPKDLASLVPKFLPSVPIDPYNGKPLTWKTYGEGVAIISWGLRGIGPADFANWNEHDHGSVAFRLWHRHLRKSPG